MDFVRSHFRKMQLWPVEHFFLHKKVPVFNWSELHFSEVTSYKIHTLIFNSSEYIFAISTSCPVIGWNISRRLKFPSNGAAARPWDIWFLVTEKTQVEQKPCHFTPLRTPGISGLKSQILKPPFLSQIWWWKVV